MHAEDAESFFAQYADYGGEQSVVTGEGGAANPDEQFRTWRIGPKIQE
jgi:hypothetical protein